MSHSILFENVRGNLNGFQKKLHKPEDETKGCNFPGNHIYSPCYTEFRKMAWYFHYPEIMGSQVKNENEDNIYIYYSKNNVHGLISSFITQFLPSIVCNPGYKARWPPNIGSIIVSHASFYLNDDLLQEFDSGFCDHYINFLLKQEKRMMIIGNLGNIPELQNFSESLPQFTTSFYMPFFYNMDETSIFPVYYCGFLDSIEHRLVLKRLLNELLIVHDSHGNRVRADYISINKVGNTVLTAGSEYELQLPKMYADYSYFDLQCDYDKMSGEHDNSIFIEDVKILSNPNNVVMSSKENMINILIPDSEFPVTKIFWCAQNQTSIENNYYSNYTTDSKDHNYGFSPIETVSISLDRNYIFRNIPGFIFERVKPIEQFSCVPIDPGLGGWNLSFSTQKPYPDPGIVIKNGTISLKLNDTNPYIELGKIESCKDEFNVKVYLVRKKEIKFIDYPKNERDKKNSRCTIQIIGN